MTESVAQRLAERIQGLVNDLEPAVVSEVRKHLAEALSGVAQDVEDDGMVALAPDGCGRPTPLDVASEESFVEGMRFAARLVADEQFDY